jgi:hypothetical protein
VPDMVVVARYANELNPATKAVIDSLRATALVTRSTHSSALRPRQVAGWIRRS